MSLYNREGQVEFLSSREVQKLLKLYVEFDKRRQAFRQEPEKYAFSLGYCQVSDTSLSLTNFIKSNNLFLPNFKFISAISAGVFPFNS